MLQNPITALFKFLMLTENPVILIDFVATSHKTCGYYRFVTTSQNLWRGRFSNFVVTYCSYIRCAPPTAKIGSCPDVPGVSRVNALILYTVAFIFHGYYCRWSIDQ
jgi:hypothetical protein